ncbi:GNAT family N-acetyltransferase [Compostibacter hankyongensis]|uniref:GNAT family N-acetyltransferase n=1 Tax=Compostibacter hankyongensis TaxID=1007089 RepID=A0ABP8G6Q8_9BACT
MKKTFYLEVASAGNVSLTDLALLTVDVVKKGASVGFIHSFEIRDVIFFWEKVMISVSEGKTILVIAKDSETQNVIGTVQLRMDMPDNQPHRGDIAKMQVHSDWRRQGIGTALLKHIEELALEKGKTLLVLDAVTNGPAYELYKRCGWTKVGDIPDYALYPDGKSYCSTTYFYKKLKDIS